MLWLIKALKVLIKAPQTKNKTLLKLSKTESLLSKTVKL